MKPTGSLLTKTQGELTGCTCLSFRMKSRKSTFHEKLTWHCSGGSRNITQCKVRAESHNGCHRLDTRQQWGLLVAGAQFPGAFFSKSWRRLSLASRSHSKITFFRYISFLRTQKKNSDRDSTAIKSCPGIVRKCCRRTITMWKLNRTLFSRYVPFLAIFAYFGPFSHLFWDFSKI